MIDKLQRADAVGDAFEVVAEAVGVIVKRVDAPLVAGVVVRDVADAVEQGIAEPHIGRGHVDFAAKRAGAVGKLAGSHALKQIEILFDATVAKRTFFAGGIGRSAVEFGFVGGQVADVSFAIFNELESVFEELIKVVAGEERFAVGTGGNGCEVIVGLAVGGDESRMRALWFETETPIGPARDQPLYVGRNRVDVCDVFFDGVRVVEAEIALTVVFAGDAEVQADRLGVTDMEVAVGLGRESRDDLGVAFFGDLGRDEVADKIGGCGRGGGRVGGGHSRTNCAVGRRESTPQLAARA